MLVKIFPFLFLSLTAAWAATEETLNAAFDVQPGGQLVVDVDFGSVEVATGNDNKVEISVQRRLDFGDEAREKERIAKVPVLMNLDGNTVTVRARPEEEKNSSWSCQGEMNARYLITVPATFNANLKTRGGAITAQGLTGEVKADTSGGKLVFGQIRGELDARTSGGSISLDGCEGPLKVTTSGGGIDAIGGKGTLEARTSGGHILVRDFRGDTEVKTSGGRLTLENIQGRVSGKTSGGSISAALAEPVGGEVSLFTSAGTIDLAVPAKAALSVEAKAGMGKIRTEIPMLATRSGDDRLEGTLNGGGRMVVLKSGVGSITIRPIENSTQAKAEQGVKP